MSTTDLKSSVPLQLIKSYLRTTKVIIPALLLTSTYLCLPVRAAGNTYENKLGGLINNSRSCTSSPLVRSFEVTDNFTLTDVNLGLNIQHAFRDDIRVTLKHPDGTAVEVISSSSPSSSSNNYDVLLDSDSSNVLNDGNDDVLAAPIYDRTAAPANSLAVFNGKSSAGTWNLEICDNNISDDGIFNAAELVLNNATPSPSSTIANGQADVGEVGTFTTITDPNDNWFDVLPINILVDGEELGPCFCSNKDLAVPDTETEFTVADITTVTNTDFGNNDTVHNFSDILDKVRRTIAAINNGFTLEDIQNSVWDYSDNSNGGNPSIINNVENGTYEPVKVTFLRAPVVGGVQSVQNFTCFDDTPAEPVASNPNLTLVKRITAVNGTPITTVVDDITDNPSTTDADESIFDNEANWPTPVDATSGISEFLKGDIIRNDIKPGDELEYTVYFLSSGDKPITNVAICDMIPANTTYVVGSMEMFINGNISNLTDASGDDAGTLFTSGNIPSVPCPTDNGKEAVVIKVVDSPTQLPNSTAPGNPNDSYGYIRFRVKVD